MHDKPITHHTQYNTRNVGSSQTLGAEGHRFE